MATYRVPDLAKFEWQKSAKDRHVLAPPGGEAAGDRYLIDGTGTGDWTGKDKKIATCISITPTVWEYTNPAEGMTVWVADEQAVYRYKTSSWVNEGDHARQHSITSTSDHTSTATSGTMLKADANGLPVDATNTDTEVNQAYTRRAQLNADLGTLDFEIA